MPAVDALTLRTAFTQQLHTPLFREAVRRFALSSSEDSPLPDPAGYAEYWGPDAALRALSVAETYYVHPDMQAFAQMAAENFPDDEVIMKEDQPSEAGFMFLPARYRLLEMNGRLLIIHAILWVNHKIWLINDKLDMEDQINISLMSEHPMEAYRATVNMVGRWDIMGMINFNFGEPMPTKFRWSGAVFDPSARVFTTMDPEQKNVVLMSDHFIDLQSPNQGSDSILTFLLAVWRLMQQTLTDVTEADDIPRPDRRRAQKQHVPTKVTIIRLRRSAYHGHGTGESINYRTIVRGHWRRVWCGPRNEPDKRYRRAVYVHPHFRGPEDAPLIIRDRVNALVR